MKLHFTSLLKLVLLLLAVFSAHQALLAQAFIPICQANPGISISALMDRYRVETCKKLYAILKTQKKIDLTLDDTPLKGEFNFLKTLTGLRKLSIKFKTHQDGTNLNTEFLASLSNLRSLEISNISNLNLEPLRYLTSLIEDRIVLDWDTINPSRCPMFAESEFISKKCSSKVPFYDYCLKNINNGKYDPLLSKVWEQRKPYKPGGDNRISFVIDPFDNKFSCPLATESLYYLKSLELFMHDGRSPPSMGSVDIKFLTGLTLRELYIFDAIGAIANESFAHNIGKISPYLTTLMIEGSNITNLEPLSDVVSLQNLILWDIPGIRNYDLTPLSPLKLKKLEFYSSINTTLDLSPLGAMQSLEKLDFNKTKNINLVGIRDLKNLKTIKIYEENLKKLNCPFDSENDVIKEVCNTIPTSQFELACEDSFIEFDPYEENTYRILGEKFIDQIKKIHYDLSYCTKLWMVSQDITHLDLSDSFVSNISSLRYYRNLKTLDISDNFIDDITPLLELEIENLDLSNNPILVNISVLEKDQDPLSSILLGNLKSLDISATSIDNITALGNRDFQGELIAKNVGLTPEHCPYGTSNPSVYAYCTKIIPFLSKCEDDLNSVRDYTDILFERISFIRPETPICPLAYGLLKETIRLDLPNKDIVDISILKGLKHLRTLDLTDNKISDISVLGTLTGLKELKLGGNNITDIEAISGLTALRYLDLHGNQFLNTSYLKDLTNLIYLNMDGCGLSNLPLSLENLANLTELYLGNSYCPFIEGESVPECRNAIENGDVIENFTALKKLDISFNKLEEINFLLTPMENLTEINLAGNNIQYLFDLEDQTQLEKINLSGNMIIPPLESLTMLTNLKELNLASNWGEDGTAINDITVLGEIPSLEVLILYDNEIVDLTPLSMLANLHTLKANHNLITSMDTVFQGTKSLINLDLRDNCINSLKGFDAALSVEKAHLENNFIYDVKDQPPIEEHPKCGTIGGTSVDEPIHLDLANLTELYLNGNNLSSLAGLSGLKAIRTLDLSGNRIENTVNFLADPLANLVELYSIERLYLNNFEDIYRNKNSIRSLKALGGLYQLKKFEMKGNLLGTDIVKTDLNCPRDADSDIIKAWCRE